jgi:phospholipase D1/2
MLLVTSTSDTDKDFILKNQIGAAIVERIKRAHEENQAFRVIVVMPLIPAFPADLSSKDAGVARLVLPNQITFYTTIIDSMLL